MIRVHPKAVELLALRKLALVRRHRSLIQAADDLANNFQFPAARERRAEAERCAAELEEIERGFATVSETPPIETRTTS